MTIMLAEVYDAFLSAGAPEDKARAAARAIADYDGRGAPPLDPAGAAGPRPR